MEQDTDVVQPEGQGDTGGDSPYSQYLEQIPEEARDAATAAFKQWDGDVTKRFQDAAEYRKTWEPFEQAGLNQYDPQALSQHLQMLQDPAAIVEWARGIAQQNGIDLAPQQEQQVPEFQFNQFEDPQQQLEQLLEQRLGPISKQLEQFGSQFQQEQQQRNLDQAHAYLEHQLDELQEKHGAAFDREIVEQLAQKYTDDPYNAIPKAWDEWQKKLAAIEKQTLQAKVDAPDPAEAGGGADVSVPKFKSLQDEGLAAVAAQYLRNNRSA